MNLEIEGINLDERLDNAVIANNCSKTCDEHEGCGEQCEYSRCKY